MRGNASLKPTVTYQINQRFRTQQQQYLKGMMLIKFPAGKIGC